MAKGSSGFDKAGNQGALPGNAKTITIETEYRKSNAVFNYYDGFRDTVLEAKQTADGNISFSHANPEFTDDRIKANTRDVKFEIKHGAVKNKKGYVEFHGINWDKVKSVSGQTYSIKDDIKEKGFRWDGKTKSWVKK